MTNVLEGPSLIESRSEGSVTDNFVWDTNREIPVMLSDGKFEYLYKGSDRVPFAQIEIATDIVTYLHSDLTGSIVASTDSDGSLIGKVDYSPYGEPTDTALSRFGYAGEWVDETTGYSFLRARWLDVKTGSFLSEDPLVQMTQSAFDYTEGNPLTQIDPLGLRSLNDMIAIPIGFSLVPTETRKANERMMRSNSGYISTGLGTASLITAGTGALAPAAPILGGLSFIFGIVSLDYELANCDGRLNDKACDHLSIGLGSLGVVTGGAGALLGKFGKSFNLTTNLDNASFLLGVISIPASFGRSIVNSLNNNNKDNSCK